jgi:hypothetical protein
VARLCGHKGAQTSTCPSQSPSRCFETARPVGRASALGAKVSGSQTDLLNPWYDGRGRAHPFPVSAGAPWRERDVARRVGYGPSQGKNNTGVEPTRPRFPPRRSACGASVTPAHPLRVTKQGPGIFSSRRSACAASVPPAHPLRVIRSYGRGLASFSSRTTLPLPRFHLCQPTMC